MHPRAAFVASAAIAMAALLDARQDRPAPQATFRTGVDVIQVDVSVLDKNRRPVLGLSAADFTVSIDGQPRPIVAFKAVDLPRPVAPSAPWIRDTAPDVATNTHPSGRVVVIVIDDGSFGQIDDAIDIRAIAKARDVARAALNELGPDDLAAVVFTENNHSAQSFTTDRQRLLTAIEKSAIFPAPRSASEEDVLGFRRGSCYCGSCSIEALGRVAEALRSLPDQRKILIYISNGVAVPIDKAEGPEMGMTYKNFKLECDARNRLAMREVFRQAQLANVTIQAIDPKGLAIGDDLRIEFLRTMAETTGGRAVVNNNEMQQLVPAVLAESSAYYLLGVESPSTKDDGRFHPMRVRVNRPDVDVHTRNGYYAPTEKERKALAADSPRGLDGSIAGALPKADLPMEVTVAPFAGANRKSELAVVASVTQPRRDPKGEPVDLVLTAVNQETGKAAGTWRQRLNVTWTPTDTLSGHYEVLSRLPLAPGRYELRVGLKTDAARTASVYTYADIPDFAEERLSVSGLIVSATPSPKLAARDGFKDLMPAAPTARRVFRAGDRVSAFLRLYQGGSRALVPVTITTRLVDSHNQPVGSGVRTIEPSEFSARRTFDIQFDVPVRLPPGEYLLTLDVDGGGKTVQRALRFTVRPPA
jgi:VWFA-related protein